MYFEIPNLPSGTVGFDKSKRDDHRGDWWEWMRIDAIKVCFLLGSNIYSHTNVGIMTSLIIRPSVVAMAFTCKLSDASSSLLVLRLPAGFHVLNNHAVPLLIELLTGRLLAVVVLRKLAAIQTNLVPWKLEQLVDALKASA